MVFSLGMVCVGLIVCFWGRYSRKVSATIMGSVWGILLGIMLIAIYAIETGKIHAPWCYCDDMASMCILTLTGATGCLLSIYLEKIQVAINVFISVFVVLLTTIFILNNIESLVGVVLIAVCIAGVLAVSSYKVYDHSFMLVTSFTGAFITSLGVRAFGEEISVGRVLFEMIVFEDSRVAFLVIVPTIILTEIGFWVQMKRFEVVKEGALYDVIKNVKYVVTWLKSLQCLQELKNDLSANKLLFVAPIVSFILCPLLSWLLEIDMVLKMIELVSEAITIGILVYVVTKKDIKFNLVYQLPYIVGQIRFMSRFYFYINFVGVLMNLFMFTFIWLVLYIVSAVVKKKFAPILLVVVGVFMNDYVSGWLYGLRGDFYMNLDTLYSVLICAGTVYFLFKRYERGGGIYGNDETAYLPVESDM